MVSTGWSLVSLFLLTYSVLQSYEREHDLSIVHSEDFEELRALCIAHPELELGPEDLFNFLG